MKGILNIVKKYMKSPVLYILAIIFTTVQGISEILLPRFMGDIVNKGIERGVLMLTAGSDVLRLLPPLVITKEDIDMMYDILNEVFAS